LDSEEEMQTRNKGNRTKSSTTSTTPSLRKGKSNQAPPTQVSTTLSRSSSSNLTSSSKKLQESLQAKSAAKPTDYLSDAEDSVQGSGNKYNSDKDCDVAAAKPERRSTDTTAKVVQKLQQSFDKEN
jgi:hypothetical protein